MKRNKRLLLKAAKRIEEIPMSYDQRHAAERSESAPCGTVSCIAGEIIIASERSIKNGVNKLWDIKLANGVDGVCQTARTLAGLPYSDVPEAIFGFNAQEWPAPYRARWFRAKTNRGKATAAAAFLRYLADGGEV